jgi:hypothetical protein
MEFLEYNLRIMDNKLIQFMAQKLPSYLILFLRLLQCLMMESNKARVINPSAISIIEPALRQSLPLQLLTNKQIKSNLVEGCSLLCSPSSCRVGFCW